MDGYTYINIFETKGIEYLIIIAFLLLLIPFWFLLNKKSRVVAKIRNVFNTLTFNTLRIPQGIFYSRNHTWLHLEKSGAAKVGLDDLLLHITGEVKVKFFGDPEKSIKKGDLIAEIDQDGRSLRIFSPISGQIVTTNPLLEGNPSLINQDPYGSGWICKIKPSSWKAETSEYYLADEATDWLRSELIRLKDFLAIRAEKFSPEASMVVLQDGGELSDHLLAELPDEIWQDFQKEFLDPSGRKG